MFEDEAEPLSPRQRSRRSSLDEPRRIDLLPELGQDGGDAVESSDMVRISDEIDPRSQTISAPLGNRSQKVTNSVTFRERFQR